MIIIPMQCDMAAVYKPAAHHLILFSKASSPWSDSTLQNLGWQFETEALCLLQTEIQNRELLTLFLQEFSAILCNVSGDHFRILDVLAAKIFNELLETVVPEPLLFFRFTWVVRA